MKSLGRIDGSVYGAVISGRPLPATRCAALCVSSASACLDHAKTTIRHYHAGWDAGRPRHGSTADSTPVRPRADIMPSRFGQGTAASSIRRSSIATTARRPLGPSFFTHQHPITSRRNHAAQAVVSAEDMREETSAKNDHIYDLVRQRVSLDHPSVDSHNRLSPTTPSIQELLDFVDHIVDDDTVEEHLQFLNDPYRRRYALSDGPEVTVSDKKEDVQMESYHPRQTKDPNEERLIEQLADSVFERLRRPNSLDLDDIWVLYQQISEPRMSHLPHSLRHALLATHGKVPRKNPKNMLRFLALVSDVKAAGLSLKTWEWNTAISFATRYVATTTVTEVEAAVRMWQEMEQVSGVQATDVTFNILFDAASKAGCFYLAEMLYEEMLRRQHRFTRYHHVTLIHFFGLKRDSNGVRAAYREMVRSGEIIDSVVLNCVMAGLLRCGEEESAMAVYEKMKKKHAQGDGIPDRNYALQKSITKVLMMFAKVGRKHPDMQAKFQQSALLAPDLSTYRILINHFGVVSGDLSKVAQFLDEMKYFRVPLHGAIFLALFKGFATHGGGSSDWDPKRLQNVWDAFLDAFDSGAGGLHISTWMGMYILQAFSLVSTREQMLDVYEALRSRWNMDAANAKFMLDFFSKLVSGRSLHALKGIAKKHIYLK